jgi:hypothetical protein
MAVNWQEIITTLGATVGGGGVLLAASAWLLKAVLTDKFARDAEAFKSRLKAEADIEIERLKSSLQMTALEHQVRFSKLHERRAEVIAEIYEGMVGVFWDGQRFVLAGGGQGDQGRREEYNKTLKRTNDFALFVDTHRIYLPDGVCALLDDFVDVVRKAVIPVGVWGNIPFPDEETHKQWGKVVLSAYSAFETKIPTARRALEAEFRAILGDPPHGNPDALVKE